MAMRKSLLQWSGMIGIIALTLAIGLRAEETKEQPGVDLEQRADILTIDSLKSFGRLERPPVIFLHDMHTNALEKEKKDCSTCHLPEQKDKDRISLKFMRLKDTNKKEAMDIYHAECIGCHKETAASGRDAGPVEICVQCHNEKTRVTSSRQALDFDKSLHFRHTKTITEPSLKAPWKKDTETNKGDCGLCHHEYDNEAKKLFYAKGKEGSCSYCHKKETEENRISMRLAAHSGCIHCHQKTLAVDLDTGPYKCSGCHDQKEQAKIKKIKDVPRIERDQPDVVLIRADKEAKQEEATVARMDPVPFDHKAHETYNDTCLVCHHASLDSCSKTCHTANGSKEGGYVNIERAMHLKGYEKSCLGCHDIYQKEPKCAACHAFMAKDQIMETSCMVCHMKTGETRTKPVAADENLMAAKLLESRRIITGTYKDEDIPEKVIIKDLSDQYEPVELPHRNIIKTLLSNIKDNKLAGYFHTEKGTICRSCHHNSPIDKKPPRCGSCHGKPFDKNALTRPGIKAAYHQQCMGCHTILNLEKPKATSCTECHKEKKK